MSHQPSKMTYKQLNEREYAELREALLNPDLQPEFIEAARSNEEFIAFVRSRVSTEKGAEVPTLATRLTESQYREASEEVERGMYETWKMLSPEDASRVSLWAEVTLRHIESGIIDASFLAAPRSLSSDGKKRIYQVLERGNAKALDDCTRDILRHLGGLPTPRGDRSVFVNCLFSRAWWRQHLLEESVNATNVPAAQLKDFLYRSQTHWEALVTLVVSKHSTPGTAKARLALIWALADLEKGSTEYEVLQNTKDFEVFCFLLRGRCAWQELDALELGEVKKLIEEDVFPEIGRLSDRK